MSQIVLSNRADLTPDAAWYALPDQYRQGQLGQQVSEELADIGHSPRELERFLHRMGVEVVQLRNDVDDLQSRVSRLEADYPAMPRRFPTRNGQGGSAPAGEVDGVIRLNILIASYLLIAAGVLCCALYVVRLATPSYAPGVEVLR